MILLLVPFAVFLLQCHTSRARSVQAIGRRHRPDRGCGGRAAVSARTSCPSGDRSTPPRRGRSASPRSGSTRRSRTGGTRWCSGSGRTRPATGSRCGGSTRGSSSAWRDWRWPQPASSALWRMSRGVGGPRRDRVRARRAVRADVQRRRHACLLPAGTLHDGLLRGRRRGVAFTLVGRAWPGRRRLSRRVPTGSHPCRGVVVRRLARVVDLARRRSSCRSPRRTTHCAPHARHQRTRRALRVADELAARERPVVHRPPPAAGSRVDPARRRHAALAVSRRRQPADRPRPRGHCAGCHRHRGRVRARVSRLSRTRRCRSRAWRRPRQTCRAACRMC